MQLSDEQKSVVEHIKEDTSVGSIIAIEAVAGS